MRRSVSTVGLVAVLVMTVACAAVAGSSLGVKIWYADWEWSMSEGRGGEHGTELMYMAQYTFIDPESTIALAVQGGMGTGWEDLLPGLGRADLLANLSVGVLDYFRVGAGYHYMQISWDAPAGDAENTYHGPELVAAGHMPLGETGLSIVGVATYIPIMWWDVDVPGGAQGDGDTYAFGFDASLSYRIDQFLVSLGYRQQNIDKAENDDGTWVPEDTFGGPYAAAMFSW